MSPSNFNICSLSFYLTDNEQGQSIYHHPFDYDSSNNGDVNREQSYLILIGHWCIMCRKDEKKHLS